MSTVPEKPSTTEPVAGAQSEVKSALGNAAAHSAQSHSAQSHSAQAHSTQANSAQEQRVHATQGDQITQESPEIQGTQESKRAGRVRAAKYILLLGAIAAIPAITTDIYLPSLPTVAKDLGTSDSMVQWTMSAMLIGGAVGQLVNGPLADRFGRKRPLLFGIALHILLSVACAFAPNIEVLIALRALQGFCNAAAMVVATAVIRDRFDGPSAARMLSQLMLVIGVAPLFAPTIGGFIASIWDWRAVFLSLGVFGLLMFFAVTNFLPETLPASRRQSGGVTSVAKNYGVLLKDPKFLALALLPAVSMTIVFCYVVGSPFVFQEEFGLSEGQFSALFAVNGVAMVLSSQANAALVGRFSSQRLLAFGIGGQLICATTLLITSSAGIATFWTVAILVWCMLAFQGFIGPNAQVLALSNYGHMVGTAVAVIGALMSGVAGAVSPLVGVFGSTAQAMSGVMVATLLTGAIILTFAIKSGAGSVKNRTKELL